MAALSGASNIRKKWFGPITRDNVEDVLRDVLKGWYALGVIDLICGFNRCMVGGRVPCESP
jgi:hypothetical protein